MGRFVHAAVDAERKGNGTTRERAADERGRTRPIPCRHLDHCAVGGSVRVRNPDHGWRYAAARPNGSRTETRQRPVRQSMKRITGSLVVCVGAGLFTAGALLFGPGDEPPAPTATPSAARGGERGDPSDRQLQVRVDHGQGRRRRLDRESRRCHAHRHCRQRSLQREGERQVDCLTARTVRAGYVHLLLCNPSADARDAHGQVSGITSSGPYRRAPGAPMRPDRCRPAPR